MQRLGVTIRVSLLSGALTLAFMCGVGVGQEKAKFNLGKYLVPTGATELERRFLTMQINEIQWTLMILQESSFPSRAGIPSFHLNPKTGKIQVLVTVSGNWADNTPLSTVENSLKAQAKDILQSLRFNIPEISDDDVFVTFSKTDTKSGKLQFDNKFAEYRGGQLTIRH
ncbi:MAG: hypothetical protein HY046_12450 [Acidobacteria bacterium]|nr:hypothetical protein [Acidobacteriota bacterium]